MQGGVIRTMDDRRQLLHTIPEVVQVLSLSRSKVYLLIASGDLSVVRIGRSVRVRAADLEKWVESLEDSRSASND